MASQKLELTYLAVRLYENTLLMQLL